ncbi:hypothetical protein MGAS2096_Spy1757 [Streptococcus pyogenes MGAS2096]|nr:hypothetical protein MGAS2096_Spy1757 [Streptococcus pyogenes MGAS2096]
MLTASSLMSDILISLTSSFLESFFVPQAVKKHVAANANAGMTNTFLIHDEMLLLFDTFSLTDASTVFLTIICFYLFFLRFSSFFCPIIVVSVTLAMITYACT